MRTERGESGQMTTDPKPTSAEVARYISRMLGALEELAG